jgi:hypothetical protein
MKKMLLAVLGLAVLACQEMKKEETAVVELPEMSRDVMAKSVIYEANIPPKGVLTHLPRTCQSSKNWVSTLFG